VTVQLRQHEPDAPLARRRLRFLARVDRPLDPLDLAAGSLRARRERRHRSPDRDQVHDEQDLGGPAEAA